MIKPSLQSGSAGSLPAKKLNQHSPKMWHSRGYLPHYDPGNAYQVLTYRLADSLPQFVLQTLSKNISTRQKRIKIENMLDNGYGSCILAKPKIVQMVIENWTNFDGRYYELIAFVVMPNHVHLLIRVFEGMSLSCIVHS